MASRPRTRAALGLLPTLLVVGACGTVSSSTPDPFAGPETRNEVRVYVQNANFYDARVYALVEGVRRQLGYVGGKTDGVFTFPLSFSQPLRLEINLLAGPTCVTEELPVDPGDTLQLQIMPDPIGQDFCR